jgi:predicted transposase/invertase (TIGR01784 family)
MPKVYEADITELVKPHYEKGLQEGLQQGLQKGLEKGEFKAKIETAKKLIQKGIDIKIIMEATGLSKKDLKKYNII